MIQRHNATSQLVTRAEEVTLDMSFNVQSQASDIPGSSIRVAIAQHVASLKAQSKAVDIFSPSIHDSKSEALRELECPVSSSRRCLSMSSPKRLTSRLLRFTLQLHNIRLYRTNPRLRTSPLRLTVCLQARALREPECPDSNSRRSVSSTDFSGCSE